MSFELPRSCPVSNGCIIRERWSVHALLPPWKHLGAWLFWEFCIIAWSNERHPQTLLGLRWAMCFRMISAMRKWWASPRKRWPWFTRIEIEKPSTQMETPYWPGSCHLNGFLLPIPVFIWKSHAFTHTHYNQIVFKPLRPIGSITSIFKNLLNSHFRGNKAFTIDHGYWLPLK